MKCNVCGQALKVEKFYTLFHTDLTLDEGFYPPRYYHEKCFEFHGHELLTRDEMRI